MISGDWWHGGVLYQIYVRSFQDSNGDGIGDLQGVIDRLDYLEWLGVNGLWLSPTMPSPNRDWGYDVSDYRGVHPDLGDLETLDRLVREAGRRGIRVLLDLVPNHTSDRHPWFVDARTSRRAEHRGFYVWADPAPDGGPPNNWLSTFGGPAWTFDDATGQWYLHNFLPEQPDLNWWDERVRDEFDGILRYWLERGIAGFRIDVAHALIKDRALRDNPPVTEEDHPMLRLLGQRPVHNMNRPEAHEVLRRWRGVIDSFGPDRLLVGETWVFGLDQLASYYGSGRDELDLGFNFPFAFSAFDVDALGAIVEATERALPAGSWPSWFGSNHDLGRYPTRWGQRDERRVRCALVVLLALRGVAFLYYGDEIGMPEVAVPLDRLRDPVGIAGWPGRDPARTPMQWTAEPGAGFTTDGAAVEPWLPLGDAKACNVEDQERDPASVLHLTRDLIRLRASSALGTGPFRTVLREHGVWVWERGDLTVAANLSEEAREVAVPDGRVLISSDRSRDGERAGGPMTLQPWEAVVLSP